jgi:hypothetical protein
MMTTAHRTEFKVRTNCDSDWTPICPECGCTDSDVANSYEPVNGKRRRRRICNNSLCRLPFFTCQPAEIVED